MQTLTGLNYLKAEIAAKHDKAYEKATWNDRLAYFETLDLEDKKTFKKASDPIGLRAASIALRDTLEGKPTGYMVSLDACSSGLQILSLLVSCPKSFDLCGGNHNDCVDSYTTIYDSMNLHGSLTRKEVKAAIMTSLYGSVAMPELTFGDNVDLFYETMEKMAPGAWDLNIGLQELWHDIKGSTYDWVMPDNFHCCIETKDKEYQKFKFFDTEHSLPVKVDKRPEFHKGLGPNLIHSIDGMIVREMFRRCSFDKKVLTRAMLAVVSENKSASGKSTPMVDAIWQHYLVTGFLSVRILDYIYEDTIGAVDAMVIAQMIQSLPEEPFDMVSVHDCFRVHPNYGNDLRRQYNIILADLNDSTLLKSMASQVINHPINVKKTGKIDRDTILESNYSLA